MKSRFFFIVILFCLVLTVVAFPSISKDLYDLPARTVSFYKSLGNFYLDSFSGSTVAVSDLMKASASFYAPLPVETVFAYIRFGEILINTGEISINGLASIGSLVTSGADTILFRGLPLK